MGNEFLRLDRNTKYNKWMEFHLEIQLHKEHLYAWLAKHAQVASTMTLVRKITRLIRKQIWKKLSIT